MLKLLIIVMIVIGFIIAERFIFLNLTRKPGGIAWIRAHKWIHPNPICIYRIPMGFVTVFLWPYFPEVAGVFCAFWMLTDMTDGTIARGCDLGTTTGEWLDPLSDKFMYIPVLFMFTFLHPESYAGYAGIDFSNYKPLALLPVITFTIIDVVGQLSRVFIKKKAANSFGKAKTTVVCTLLIFIALKYTCFEAFMSIPLISRINMDYLMWACVILSFLSFYCKVVPANWYANSLTFMNFVCGATAIPVALMAEDGIVKAFILIFIGQFFDLLDGRTARKFGSTLRGALFDDIADGTSFGLAIATILFVTLRPIGSPTAATIAIIYTVAVFYRLYQFLKNKDANPEGIFIGLPSPAGAMLAGSSAILFSNSLIIVAFITLLSAGIMVSKIRYKHFGQKIWGSLPNGIKLTLFAIALIYITILFKAQNQFSDAFAFFCFSMIIIFMIFGIETSDQKSVKK